MQNAPKNLIIAKLTKYWQNPKMPQITDFKISYFPQVGFRVRSSGPKTRLEVVHRWSPPIRENTSRKQACHCHARKILD